MFELWCSPEYDITCTVVRTGGSGVRRLESSSDSATYLLRDFLLDCLSASSLLIC